MDLKRGSITIALMVFWVAALGAQPGATEDELPEGWSKAGSFLGGAPDDYKVGIAPNASRNGTACAFLKAKKDTPAGFGTLMQSFTPGKEYLGKRVQMSAYVKSEGVEGWAGLWMRVDGPEQGRSLSFDNMSDRPIEGTSDWTLYEIVLDVPREATGIAFGILLNGVGQTWLDDLQFEVVGEEVPEANLKAVQPKQPRNLGFDGG